MSSTPASAAGVATKINVNGTTHPAPIAPSSSSASPAPGLNGNSTPQLAQLDPELRSSINSALLHNGGITRIHTQLLDNLQRTGWTAAIHARCLELLRSGECTTYDRLMKRILAEVAAGDGDSGPSSTGKGNGNGNGTGPAHKEQSEKIRVPESVIQDGIKVVKRELEDIAEVIVE